MTGLLSNTPWVILIDVDGTLVTGPASGPSAGLLAMNEAAFQLTGINGLGNQMEFAGGTDIQLGKKLLQKGGISHPADTQVEQLLDIYLTSLEAYTEQYPYRSIGFPRATIPLFHQKGHTVGLGTGNLAQGTSIKLRSAGIQDLFDMTLGGYGDDGELREHILQAAISRCDPRGALPVVIIGDTPKDILGAHRAGAKCIGIPHGKYTLSDLMRAGADAVAEQFDSSLVRIIDTLPTR